MCLTNRSLLSNQLCQLIERKGWKFNFLPAFVSLFYFKIAKKDKGKNEKERVRVMQRRTGGVHPCTTLFSRFDK